MYLSTLKIISDYEVEWCVLDFEKAAWRALEEVFPNVKNKGCLFYFCQVYVCIWIL